jgi:hypothetical protein
MDELENRIDRTPLELKGEVDVYWAAANEDRVGMIDEVSV